MRAANDAAWDDPYTAAEEAYQAALIEAYMNTSRAAFRLYRDRLTAAASAFTAAAKVGFASDAHALDAVCFRMQEDLEWVEERWREVFPPEVLRG